jgi:regulator of protease activity HflC (stomatin/prohibitin superfamily)
MGDEQTDRVRAVEPADAGVVARAMNEVLAAERAAAAAVEDCRAQLAAALADARLEARQRVERAEALAQAIHGRAEAVANARAAALTAAASAAATPARPLPTLVDALAAWLVGAGDG